LKPNVTQEGRAAFPAGESPRLLAERSGPLRRTRCLRSYFLFPVKYAERPRGLFAIDAVDGSLDLFEFLRYRLNGIAEMEPQPAEATLTTERAVELLRDKSLARNFPAGFFQIAATPSGDHACACELHLPYWLGFRERAGAVRCRVMDAVRRRHGRRQKRARFRTLARGLMRRVVAGSFRPSKKTRLVVFFFFASGRWT